MRILGRHLAPDGSGARPQRREDQLSTDTFLDPHTLPTGRELEGLLGPATALWERLLHDLSTGLPVWERWRFGGRSRGWRLQVRREPEGPTLYLEPRRAHFIASFGRGPRLDIRTWRDLIALEDRVSLRLVS
jgi:hypothetical protein